MRSFAPLTLRLQPSRRLRVVLALAHLAAAASVALAELPVSVALLLFAAVALSLVHLRAVHLPASLVLRDAGRFQKVGADGTATEAEVHPLTAVTLPLIVLVHRVEGRTRSLVLASDSLSADDARELRLWLRRQATTAQAA